LSPAQPVVQVALRAGTPGFASRPLTLNVRAQNVADIKPKDSSLLTDEDVEHEYFRCCGDEDLVFLRCPSCGHIWVLCYECDTSYPDLTHLSVTESSFLSSTEERIKCPSCHKAFADFCYLKEGIVDSYLPTAEQVIRAGHGQYLARHLREKHGIK